MIKRTIVTRDKNTMKGSAPCGHTYTKETRAHGHNFLNVTFTWKVIVLAISRVMCTCIRGRPQVESVSFGRPKWVTPKYSEVRRHGSRLLWPCLLMEY